MKYRLPTKKHKNKNIPDKDLFIASISRNLKEDEIR